MIKIKIRQVLFFRNLLFKSIIQHTLVKIFGWLEPPILWANGILIKMGEKAVYK